MYPTPQCMKYLQLQTGCSKKASNLPGVARKSETSALEGQGICLLTQREEGLSPFQPHNFTFLCYGTPCKILWGSLQCSSGCWSSPLLQPLKVRTPHSWEEDTDMGFLCFPLPGSYIIPKILCPFLPSHGMCGGWRTNRRLEI